MIRHELEIPSIGVTFEADRLRRDRHELHGELLVRCKLPGAKTVNDCLVTGDFNFSSVKARQDRAKLLATRAGTNGNVDWYAYLEEFCQGVFEREREGDPAVNIWDIPLPPKEDDFAIDGLAFPRRHPSILFGDGGSAKSYVALYLAGKLALQGIPVALFDWELSGDEHRERFERLFGSLRPKLTYCRCETALTSEVDRLARVIREHGIVYAFFDSISFACDGRPEEAETASRYFRACRTLGIGSLHIAHVNKKEEGDQKPYGTAFWYNGARSIWYVKAVDGGPGAVNLGFFQRKSNLGPLRAPAGLRLNFTSDRTSITRQAVSDVQELADKMSVPQRMAELLKSGGRTAADLAAETGVEADTILKIATRSHRFVLIRGNAGEQDRIGLRTEQAS